MTFRPTFLSGIRRILFKLQSSRIWSSLAAKYQTTWRQTQENQNLDTAKRSTTPTRYYVVQQVDCHITQGTGLRTDTERYVIFLSHKQASGERRLTSFETFTPAWAVRQPTQQWSRKGYKHYRCCKPNFNANDTFDYFRTQREVIIIINIGVNILINTAETYNHEKYKLQCNVQ